MRRWHQIICPQIADIFAPHPPSRTSAPSWARPVSPRGAFIRVKFAKRPCAESSVNLKTADSERGAARFSSGARKLIPAAQGTTTVSLVQNTSFRILTKRPPGPSGAGVRPAAPILPTTRPPPRRHPANWVPRDCRLERSTERTWRCRRSPGPIRGAHQARGRFGDLDQLYRSGPGGTVFGLSWTEATDDFGAVNFDEPSNGVSCGGANATSFVMAVLDFRIFRA